MSAQNNNHNQKSPFTPILQFLESDATLYIAIGLSLVGLVVMAFFISLLEGMARVHISVVSFLFLGLFLSLLYYMHLKRSAEAETKFVSQQSSSQPLPPTDAKQETQEREKTE